MLGSIVGMAVAFADAGFAQSVNEAAKARRDQLTEQERAGDARRDSANRQALEKAKLRARKVKACKAQAKQRGLHLFERRRFIRTCAAQ